MPSSEPRTMQQSAGGLGRAEKRALARAERGHPNLLPSTAALEAGQSSTLRFRPPSVTPEHEPAGAVQRRSSVRQLRKAGSGS